MHGLYKIRVVDLNGTEVLDEYFACTHPTKGDSLATPNGVHCRVESVCHILKTDQNGAKRYTSFSHVLLTVY